MDFGWELRSDEYRSVGFWVLVFWARFHRITFGGEKKGEKLGTRLVSANQR